ncbi:MAG: hypothetical protein JW932_04515 [Deltaproteobacteria bacterium]|nr:hypothetical protein [Deltaproteobacteria bacterium]
MEKNNCTGMKKSASLTKRYLWKQDMRDLFVFEVGDERIHSGQNGSVPDSLITIG